MEMKESKIKVKTLNLSRSSDFDFKFKIGSGGFGDVYMATHKVDGRDYALKEIPIKGRNGKSEKKIREVKCLSHLEHPNVVRYYGSWIEPNQMASEYLTDSDDEGTTEMTNGDFEASLPDSYVVFKRESEDKTVIKPIKNCNNESSDDCKDELKYSMYIQMELCNATLRHAMTSKFWFKDNHRRDRLFQEIVKGLAHIHGHDIIHRDLKPGNIFLDSHDRVKIGDFGLATKADFDLSDEGSVGSSQTRSIGTYLYIAPEVKSPLFGVAKIAYTQKVDIYSLGIIFFEMYYPLQGTKNERIQVLSDLRRLEIKLPSDVDHHLSSKKISLVKWLLNYDIDKRPTADKLLESAYIQSLKNVNDKKSDANGADKFKLTSKFNLRFVNSKLTKIFQSYKAIRFFVPYTDTDSLHAMDKVGNVKFPPNVLLFPFCRYIAENRIFNLRRYSIEKIFLPQRKDKTSNKIDECTFDIVSEKENLNGSTIPEVEILNLLYDILRTFEFSKKKSIVFRVNHVDLLRGLLLYYGIPAEKHSIVLDIFAELNNEIQRFKQKSQVNQNQKIKSARSTLFERLRQDDKLIDLNSLSNLLKFYQLKKESIQDLRSYFNNNLIKRNSHHVEGIKMINQAISEMDAILNAFDACDNNFSVQFEFVPLIMNHNYSGIIFQLEVENVSRKSRDVIAIGGRYDELINHFAVEIGADKKDLIAVGLSIDIWRLAQLIIRKPKVNPHRKGSRFSRLRPRA